ncbi:outer membrane beta-barrel protein [Muricauda sp. JGD-17]|uniref:Outer membrane beta-barrel protein n=2 Tax=Flagellimonas ochracea TaxID=2696472 RepID=A0A964TD83_9FLAO|nr:outer membrane beta-barrel protein [Allomuricauda ochracea]
MKNYLLVILLLLCFLLGNAQDTQDGAVFDEKYLEDQFYLGLGFNFLLDRSEDVNQRSLSYNFQLGFIKDIPLNSRRNFGLGLGIGYATNSYYSNIGASEVGDIVVYEVLTSDQFKRSKLETHTVEFPLELRWRTSTLQSYKFWRIYAGAKLGYVFSGRSRLVTDEVRNGFSNPDIQDLQYGLTLSFGYNTWNIHAYYALNPLLKDGTVLDNNETIDLRVLRIGVIFYIL